MTAAMVSIVICTRNRCGLLDRCLSAVAHVWGVERAEVLVVDNGSTDDTAAVVERWSTALPRMRSVYEATTGLSHARNAGVGNAHGALLAFIDDDVLVDPGWLDGLYTAYEHWPDAAGVAGRVELSWPAGRPDWLPTRREVWFARFEPGGEERRLADDEYPVGANMSVRRDIALAIGGFDPALGYAGSRLFGNEERDFFDRVRRSGASLVYGPAASVVHVVEGARTTRRYLYRRLYDQGRSDVRAGTDMVQGHRPIRLASDALGRALVRGWRSDIRRIARSGRRDAEVVDVVAGRVKQLGIAREALALMVRDCTRRG